MLSRQMHAPRTLVTILTFALAIDAYPAFGAQTRLVVRDCDACSLTATRLLSLGDANGPGTIDSESPGVREDGRGNFLVFVPSGEQIKVFSASGRYLETIGRAGAGPGEFRRITTLAAGAGDSVYVLDSDNARMTVLSPDHEPVRFNRSSSYLSATNLIALGRTGLVMQGRIRSPERAGYPVHLLNWDGQVIRSFGSASGALRPDIQYMDSRAVAAASRPGGVWLAYRNKYEIELWDVSGRHISTLVRRVDWFEDWFVPGVVGLDPERGPRPRIGTIYEDEGEILFVAISVADPEWKQSYGASGHVEDPLKYTDTIVEAIDATTGRALGSLRFDNKVTKFLGGGRVAGVEYDSSGVPRLVIWRLSVDNE